MKAKISKVIFCHKSHNGVIGGLPMCDNRIHVALKKCFENVVEIDFKPDRSSFANFFDKVSYKFNQISNHYDDDTLEKIRKEILEPDETLLFISHSVYGNIEKKIKQKYPTITICTFFHNEEFDVVRLRWKRQKNIGNIIDAVCRYFNEKLVSNYSDYIFLLNQRDKNLFFRYYGTRDVVLLPFTLVDKCPNLYINKNLKRELKLLFVGTYFYGNVEGVRRFVKEVAPFISADFYVVGNQMDKLKEELPQSDNVYYVGRVTDEQLYHYYIESDIVIAPVVVGGGMKTKVVEAMMYGKPVIGTTESFQGYEEYIEKVGFCCDEIKSFKKYIDLMDKDRERLFELSMQSRQTFVDFFSNEKTVEVIKNTFSI